MKTLLVALLLGQTPTPSATPTPTPEDTPTPTPTRTPTPTPTPCPDDECRSRKEQFADCSAFGPSRTLTVQCLWRSRGAPGSDSERRAFTNLQKLCELDVADGIIPAAKCQRAHERYHWLYEQHLVQGAEEWTP